MLSPLNAKNCDRQAVCSRGGIRSPTGLDFNICAGAWQPLNQCVAFESSCALNCDHGKHPINIVIQHGHKLKFSAENRSE